MATVRYELGRVARKRGHEGQIWNSSDKSTNHLRQGRENIAKALCGPHLPIKEDIPGSVLGGVTVNTEERRIEVLVTRKKLRLPYSPEMFAV